MKYVPLSELTVSPRNVRTTRTDLSQLKTSIAAYGLLQPLVAVKGEDGLQVIAGGRRLAAMQELAEDGHEFAKIPVQVISEEQAEQASLAENMVREAMRPYETYEAIAGLDLTQKEIATRFALPIDYVRKCQRLGRLHPTIMQAYKDGELNDTQAQAYASSPDPEEQLRVYEAQEQETYGKHSPFEVKRAFGFGQWEVKQMLREVEDQYKAAGGKIEADLFGEDKRVCDPVLLQEVYEAHIKAEDERIAAECGCEVSEEEPGEGYIRYWPDRRASDEDEARINEIEELYRNDDEIDDEAYDKLAKEYDELREKRRPVTEEGTLVWRGNFFRPYVRQELPSSKNDDEALPTETMLTQKATAYLEEARRERFFNTILHDAEDAVLFYLFTRRRQLAEQEGDYMNARVEGDELAAFEAYKETGDHQGDACMLLLGQYTGKLDRTGAYSQLAARQPQLEWESREEFWQLFRKKADLFTLTDEFAPAFRTAFTNSKVADIQTAAHELCSGKQIISIPIEEREAATRWTPPWLRFEDDVDDEQLEEAA